MNLRFGIGLCAVVVGLTGLTLCQPPKPRIARVDVPPFPTVDNAETKNILAVYSQAEQVIQRRDPEDPLAR